MNLMTAHGVLTKNEEEELYLEISRTLIYYGVPGTDVDQCAHEIMDLFAR